jgi:hypothetical protein
MYCEGKLSENARRGFKKAIQPAVDSFLENAARARVGGSVYLDSPHPLPFALPHKYQGVTFDELPIDEILSELDLTADTEVLRGPHGFQFRYVAPFLEAYFAKRTSEINQKLRRRLHWLAE